MKRTIISLIFILSVLTTFSQDINFNKFSYGFQLNKFQDEFGFGINVLSQEYKNFRLSAKGNINWLNHLDSESNETWTEFFNNQFGINYHGCITNRIGLYAEGGLIILYPNTSFSSKSSEFGGYGLFGFEFFFTEDTKRNPSYFIELGGIGTGAYADKIISNPIYANGFLISVGYRF